MRGSLSCCPVMVPFEDVLFQVRKALQVSPGLVHNLLRELHEANVFSTKYYQSLYKDGEVEEQRLCEVICNDGDYLARRLSLPIWQNWDISQGILDSALRKLDDFVPSGELTSLNVLFISLFCVCLPCIYIIYNIYFTLMALIALRRFMELFHCTKLSL